ncbi:MAG: transglutaminaseTgpA domain-containing protein, partial [Mycobacteriaceae bacterium]
MSTASVVNAARPTQSVLGALALLLTSATLVPLFTSNRWVLPLAATVAVIALVGVVLRAVRMPAVLVVVGQMIALTATLTLVFTDAKVLRVLPGPAAIRQFRALLTGAGTQIVAEKVPVALSPEMSLLVVGSLGCAAIIVDVLVALASVPAVAGLVLLSVVAVPVSLTRELLPWWSFVLGAGGLVLLFLSDGGRRSAVSGPGAAAAGLRSPGATIA